MTKNTAKNVTKKRNGNKKNLVAALCIVLSLAVITAALLAVKNPFYYSVAQKKAESGDFSAAAEAVVKSEGERADVLEKYILLRLDISRCYPDLLSEFNIEKINDWYETAAALADNDALGEKITADAAHLSETLSGIISDISEYEILRDDVLSMMDVFLEINRLHTKGADGKNIGFTVAEEKEKIRTWESQCNALEQYALGIDGSESIYLLNYLIKEVQGECTDLEKAIDSVTESGYSETDKVRFSGEGRKTYPDIRSNNASVNLLEKNGYELYVYKGICRTVTERLRDFYAV